jgi:F-box protein 18 (helicase)
MTEQEQIIESASKNKLTKVEAIAGSGKSSTSIEVLNNIQYKSLYLVYNTANAKEMNERITNPLVEILTIQSYASRKAGYHYLRSGALKSYGYEYFLTKLKYIKDKKIRQEAAETCERIYDKTNQTGDLLKDVNVWYDKELITKKIYDKLITIVSETYLKQAKAEITIDLSALVKLYLAYINSTKDELPEYHTVVVDEAQDLDLAQLKLFDSIKAKHKIIIGDSHQELYHFRGSYNAFIYYKDKGVSKTLSKSYRIQSELASKIENFGNNYFKYGYRFKGVEEPEHNNEKAMIFRTNIGILKYMIKTQTYDYNFIKPVDSLLYPIIKTLEFIENPEKSSDIGKYKPWLKKLYDDNKKEYLLQIIKNSKFYREKLKEELKIHEEIGLEELKKLYYNIKKTQKIKKPNATLLLTGHASKGKTFEEVTIADDFEYFLAKTLHNKKDNYKESIDTILNSGNNEWHLYYVVATRATKKLEGYLDPLELDKYDLEYKLHKLIKLKKVEEDCIYQYQ